MIDLKEGEKIVLEVRKHWFLFVFQIITFTFVALAPLLVFAALFLLPVSIEPSFVEENFSLATFFYSLWLLGVWVAFFLAWTDYFLDVWYVTNKRIIDVEQRGVFNREVSTLYYERIQDITIEVRGMIATLLNFGDLHVQTAGENRDIVLKNATAPSMVKSVIGSLIEKETENIQRVRIVDDTSK